MQRIIESLHSLRRSLETCHTVSQDPEQAESLVCMLRSVWPDFPLVAVLFQQGDQFSGRVADQLGKARPEWAELLQSVLGRQRTVKAPDRIIQAPELPVHSLTIEAVHGSRVVLVVGLPADSNPDLIGLTQGLLSICSQILALRFALEAQESHGGELEEELQDQSWLANIGELVGPVAHEMNNFFNGLTLHLAVLEHKLPETFIPELAELGKQVLGAAELVKQLQQVRRQQSLRIRPVEINLVIRETVSLLTQQLYPKDQLRMRGAGHPEGETAAYSSIPVELDLASDLPPVLGSRVDLKRLLAFLLNNAAAAAGTARITVRTRNANAHVELRVEDPGPSIPSEFPDEVFDLSGVCRKGTNVLELAACKALAGRLQARILCQNRHNGGVAMIVELRTV